MLGQTSKSSFNSCLLTHHPSIDSISKSQLEPALFISPLTAQLMQFPFYLTNYTPERLSNTDVTPQHSSLLKDLPVAVHLTGGTIHVPCLQF